MQKNSYGHVEHLYKDVLLPGALEGTFCNWHCYMQNYPDLKDAGITSAEAAEAHYISHGESEGRNCRCNLS